MAELDEKRIEVLSVILRPVVSYCLRHSISSSDVLEVLKATFVRLASEEIKHSGQKQTVSRLSVMTGIRRREVKRFIEKGQSVGSHSSLPKRILGRWEQDPRFVTKSKKPRVLSCKGPNSEFEQLVCSVSNDVGPVAILDELARLGLVECKGNNVKLLSGVYSDEGDPEKGLAILARDIETFSQAAEENIFTPQDPKNLHICTSYDNIFKSDLKEIRQWLYKEGQLFHKRARDYLSKFDKDINPQPGKKGGSRVSVVAFSFTAPDSEQ